jgi:phosphopantothenate-cysteine ligase
LDYLTGTEDGPVVVQNNYQQQMAGVLRRYRKAKKGNLLLLLPFTTVNDYLWYLRELAILMQPLQANALFYLAAAVSDFFVPADRMVEHKIQSSEDYHVKKQSNGTDDPEERTPAAHMEGGSLVIDLDPVPKFLKLLVDEWSPHAMIVSFKLETDSALLATKSKGALEKYSHHLVIGNLLNTRKYEVLFVSKIKGEDWVRVPREKKIISTSEGEKDGWGEPTVEIESLIVPKVKDLHSTMITAESSHV